jgi:hypothetical protein
MGRDMSVVCEHSSSVNPLVRAIINSDYKVDFSNSTIAYSLKSHKVFLFDAETEERIRF